MYPRGLTQADIVIDPTEAELDPHSMAWLESDTAEATNHLESDERG